MPKGIMQYKLLISCPRDVTKEVKIIQNVVLQFNKMFSDTLGIHIETKYWRKDSYPQSGGKPQALLNKQIVNDCDAVVAIFWTRFGTPTDEYGSGTEEEVERMLSLGKQVFMYFSEKPISPAQKEDEEYRKIQEFRARYKDQGIYFTYSSDAKFKQLFFAHLTKHFLSKGSMEEVSIARQPKLKIVGINQDKHLSDNAQLLNFVPNFKITTNMYFEKIRSLIYEIASIKIEQRRGTFGIPNLLVPPDNQFIEIAQEQREIIFSIAERLDIRIPDDFFVLGNLTTKSSLLFSPMIIREEGTDEEKKKYQCIQKLLDMIGNVQDLEPIEKKLSGLQCLKLALKNFGTDFDEDVEITIRIPPKNLFLVERSLNFSNEEMEYLLNNYGLNTIFGISGTSEYSEYILPLEDRHLSPSVAIFPSSLRNYREEFRCGLHNVFCYERFDEEEEYILKLKFNYIKHNNTIAFPSVIFVKESFGSLPYSITSKHLPEKIFGKIKITID